MSDGRKFKIFYSSTHPDPAKAGKEYKPPKGKMLVMNNSGIFFLYESEPFYPSISLLHEQIGNYDVVWTNKKETVNQQLLEAIKIAIECLGLHGDGFVDLGAMTVLQDFEAAVAAAQEQGK
jgi:ribosomal protein L24E